MLKVAVTGIPSCGKSSACQIFKELGAHTESADEIVHRYLSPKTETGQEVVQLLGKDIVCGEELDRKKIAAKVFPHRELLTQLEQILHPQVWKALDESYAKQKQLQQASLFVVEVPLLFEVDADKFFTETVCIVADINTCLNRFMAKNANSKEEFDLRLSRHFSQAEKSHRANTTIHNDGSLADLKASIETLYNEFSSRSTSIGQDPIN